MAFDPLPSPSSFATALATIENQLGTLDALLGTFTFTAKSSDGNITVVADASIAIDSIAIASSLLTGSTAVSLTALASSIVTVANQALTLAHTKAISQVATSVAAFNLQGVCVPNGAQPNFAGFAPAAAALTAEEPAIDQSVAARQFTGQIGVATAVASGHLDVVSLTISTLPDYLPQLVTDVGNAINKALQSTKGLVDGTIIGVVDGLPTNTVKMTDLCLYSRNTIAFNNAAQLTGTKLVGSTVGTFAAMGNAGSGPTSLSTDVQVGNVWSRGPVTLADRAQVNGFIKTNQTVTRGNATVVTGSITQNGFFQIPSFGFSVTFPGTNSGAVTLQPNTQKTLAPGSYAALIVNAGATLSLSTGTYFFTSFDMETNGTISCSSTGGQVIVYVSGNVIYRGKIVEKTGGRPKFFMGAFGTGSIPLGGPFTGTLAAPSAQIVLNTVAAPGHSGAFFGQDIQVDPNQTITWFPFSGTPSLGTF
jgi:DNA-binding protein YbaB